MLNQIGEIQGIGLHLDQVLRSIQEAYLQKFETLGVAMTIELWVILHQIYEMGDAASQRDVVQSNFRNRATISRVIGGLERKGWIKKSRFDGDQKRFKLELTPKGRDIIDKVLPHAFQLRKLAIKAIQPEDFTTFLAVLEKIGNNYKA